uniref:Flavoprotein domain-containing protein n=1 Tax=Palpitomonas bilix TaxID=652834 RepID=A0A7S3D743_9EUKA|mmetsp:Transcript_2523/g.5290  ORF Transcript_2523/g.5290 Transcript_2523/m.5290 type:complete len:195 (+) Transcript_2523:272-856(+)
MDRKKRILLGLSGSVASVKAKEMVTLLKQVGEVRVVATAPSLHFVSKPELEELGVEVLGDSDEWERFKQVGDEVLHIELRKWADAIVVAPLSANTLAKMAFGMADSLLSCVLRAWDFSQPCVLAPAMNTAMWQHPVTAEKLDRVRQYGAVVVMPVAKKLACGDVGVGAMEKPALIVEEVVREMEKRGEGGGRQS